MLTSLKSGWRAAWNQRFLLAVLFLYRFLWGVALYRCIQSIVVPLLQRFPAESESREQARLFLAEAEFRLTKTDISQSYLWMFAFLLLARALLTPMLNAGVLYSLRHTQLNTGYRFFKGMKTLAPSFFGYYLAQTALLLPALLLFWPELKEAAASYNPALLLGESLLLKLAALIAYGFGLRLLFLHLQLGRAAEAPFFRTLLRSLLRFPLLLAVALTILLVSGLLGGAVLAVTLWKAGLWTLILYQAYGFLRTFFSLWGITAQQHLLEAGTGI